MSHKHPMQGIGRLAGLFGVSRQVWYQNLACQEQRDMEEGIILYEVKKIRQDLPKCGVEKLHHELQQRGIYERWVISMGRDKLADLLRRYDLLGKTKRKRAKTTDSNHPFYKYPNIIKDFTPTAPNQLWVSDITYIHLAGDNFSYLSLITDAYSRKIVGWALSKNLSTKGCLNALNMAIESAKKRGDNLKQLIHHSDRGVQYCSNAYTELLKKQQTKISMTHNRDPYENALAERMNRTIKEELLENRRFFNFKQANDAIEKVIHIYNNIRPHASLGFLKPSQVHERKKVIEPVKKWYPKKYQKTQTNNPAQKRAAA